jgi:RNA polymerase sigma factor (sigma-70 family)
MTVPTPSPGSSSGGVFVTTHWSLVARAAEADPAQSEAALEELCRTYWYPLYAYIRRLGRSPQDAEDLTQSFFARLLEKKYLADAEPEKGKFRTFLLTALKRFLANEWDREHAQKRGGFQTVLSIDQAAAESRWASEPGHDAAPDVLFERQWARILLDLVLHRLEQEYAQTGRAALFVQLRPCLARGSSAHPYAEIASGLGVTEAAVKMAVQRLRARYRQILQEEIRKTVLLPEEVDAEIRHLFTTFSS